MELSILGQLTEKDCWISATVVAIFLGMDTIPSIKWDRKYTVSFGDDRKIILKSIPNDYREAVIRATRVYFSEKDFGSDYQKDMKIESLNRLGCPDLITELFFGRKFETYSTSRLSFYSFKSTEECKTELINRKNLELFLLTYKFNPDHLYVYINMKLIDNIYNIQCIDISDRNIRMVEIPLTELSILLRLSLVKTEDS
jgi:hypothetical protein